MKSLYYIFVTLLSVQIYKADDDVSFKIVGGKNALEGKYPFVVSLQDGSNHYCGGSIINKNWIITAAHCLKRNKNPIVVIGTTSFSKKKDENIYNTDRIVIYEDWNENGFVSDLGLIKLNKDIVFNDNVKPVKLPITDFNDTEVVLIGWGRLSNRGSRPDNLQEIVLRTIDRSKCAEMMDHLIDDTHICTLTKSDEGACNGDSGSPLLSKDGILIGITSYGIVPCASNHPDVYTNVYRFLYWIDEQIN